MKIPVVILFLLMNSQMLLAQMSDSIFIDRVFTRAENHLLQHNIDSSIYLAQLALQWHEQQKDRPAAADCQHLLARAHYQNNNIPLALRFYLQTLKSKESSADQEELSHLHFELAELYEAWSVYSKSISHYQYVLNDYVESNSEIKKRALAGLARNFNFNHRPDESLSAYQELKNIYSAEQNQLGLVETLREIIKIHQAKGDFNQALNDNKEVLAINEARKDSSEIIVSLNNIGVLQRQLNNLDEALQYFIRSADLQRLAEPLGNPTTLTNIGILYQNQRNFQESLRYLFDAEKTLKAQKPMSVTALSEINNLLSVVYLSMNDLNNAYIYNQESIALASAIGDKNLEQVGYRTRANIYEQFNDFEQALLFFQKHTTIKDSLSIVERAQRERDLLKQFSAEQAEKEISLLAIDREIEDLKYQQDLLENEKLRQDQALQQSLIARQQLEKDQTEQALKITQQQLEQEKSQQELLLTQQKLEAEQKDRQIASLENAQTRQALEITQQDLEAEQRDKDFAQSEKAKVELQLSLQEKDFELKTQSEEALRNFMIGFLVLSLIILGLLFRTSRIRNRANKILGKQKQELESALSDLQQTQAQLLQSDKMASLGQLTAGVAHEINNPINFITTSIDALKFDVQDLQSLLNSVVALKPKDENSVKHLIKLRDELDVPFLKQEVGELVSNIEIGANRTHDIVTALRTYSRDTTERFISTNIHEGIDSSLIILNHKKGDGITVHKNYGQIPEVSCMASRLNQVFLNILDNAIQAIGEKGDIYITTQKNDYETVSISFRDTGTGMSEQNIKNAFNPFYTTKEVGSGTGLGLYVSYNIIEQHMGMIDIKSEPGAGTEFVITLPIKQEHAK